MPEMLAIRTRQQSLDSTNETYHPTIDHAIVQSHSPWWSSPPNLGSSFISVGWTLFFISLGNTAIRGESTLNSLLSIRPAIAHLRIPLRNNSGGTDIYPLNRTRTPSQDQEPDHYFSFLFWTVANSRCSLRIASIAAALASASVRNQPIWWRFPLA